MGHHFQIHATDNDAIMKIIWRLKLPPKVKNMIWHAFANCLPAAMLLHSRNVDISADCPICHQGQETILHSPVTCPFCSLVSVIIVLFS